MKHLLIALVTVAAVTAGCSSSDTSDVASPSEVTESDAVENAATGIQLPIRARIHSAIATALRPGGRFILEAYTPDQIGRGTGGGAVIQVVVYKS